MNGMLGIFIHSRFLKSFQGHVKNAVSWQEVSACLHRFLLFFVDFPRLSVKNFA